MKNPAQKYYVSGIILAGFLVALPAYAIYENLGDQKYKEEDFSFEKGDGYEVHEYQIPSGERGIQYFEYLQDGSVISYGYGPLSANRTYSIDLAVADISTSSPDR